MGFETVIFILIAANLVQWILYRDKIKRADVSKEKTLEFWHAERAKLNTRNVELETEIQRLRTIPLTQKPDKTENAVIKAKSPAQVRQITESAFGKQPEIGMEN